MVAGLFLCGFLNRRVVVAGRVGTVGLGRLAAKTEAAMVFGGHHDDGFSLYSESYLQRQHGRTAPLILALR